MLPRHFRMRYASHFLIVALVCFGLAACDDNATSPNDNNTTAGDTTLTDGQILHIARTANQGEVLTSQPAVAKAVNDSVRQFAQQMVTEHSQTVQRADSLGTNRQVTLRDNPVSLSLHNSARGTVTQLNALSGAAFDRTYMEAQLSLHQNTLNMLDYTLIPKSQDAQVRSFLTTMRAAVAMHLAHARSILRMLP